MIYFMKHSMLIWILFIVQLYQFPLPVMQIYPCTIILSSKLMISGTVQAHRIQYGQDQIRVYDC